MEKRKVRKDGKKVQSIRQRRMGGNWTRGVYRRQ